MNIKQASVSDIDQVAPLFDAYRQFYGQPSDLSLARTYLEQRLEHGDCTIFAAIKDDGSYIGFTLLYPTFCSVEAQSSWILYDLFVAKDERRKGVAESLLNTAQDFAARSGATWIRLETAVSNIPGQQLYEKLGWERDEEYHTYFFALPVSHERES